MSDLKLLQAGTVRLVHSQRARVLRKRGEYMRWSPELQGYIWWPKKGSKA